MDSSPQVPGDDATLSTAQKDPKEEVVYNFRSISSGGDAYVPAFGRSRSATSLVNDGIIAPDGGWGWVVCAGSFAINFILDGTMFSFGLLMLELLSDLGQDKSTTSWIGSSQMGIHMCMGPMVSVLMRHFSIRQVVVAGSLLASVAFMASVVAPSVPVLIFTYGVVGGIGIGMVFLPAIIVVGQYFSEKRAIATGISTSGSGVGTFAYAYLTNVLLENYRWRGTVLLLAGLLLHCVICGMLFRPLHQFKVLTVSPSNTKETRILLQEDQPKGVGAPYILVVPQNRSEHNSSPLNTSNTIRRDLQGEADDIELDEPVLADDSGKDSLHQLSDRAQNSSSMFTPYDSSEHLSHDTTEHPLLDSSKYTLHDNSKSPQASSEHSPQDFDDKNISRFSQTFSQREDKSQGSDSMSVQKTNSDYQLVTSIDCRGGAQRDSCQEKKRTCSDRGEKSTSGTESIAESQDWSRCRVVCQALTKFLPLELLTKGAFIMLLVTFTMWTAQTITLTYLPDLAVSKGISRPDAAFLISIVGVTNVLGRLIAGFITDCFHIPSICLYVVALSLAAVVNLALPFCDNLLFLQLLCAVFGLCMAVAVSLRTIVLIEQLGVPALTESFGIVALFQGVAFSFGPPIAGKLSDSFNSLKPPFIMSSTMYSVSALSALGVACLNHFRKKSAHNQKKDALL